MFLLESQLEEEFDRSEDEFPASEEEDQRSFFFVISSSDDQESAESTTRYSVFTSIRSIHVQFYPKILIKNLCIFQGAITWSCGWSSCTSTSLAVSGFCTSR